MISKIIIIALFQILITKLIILISNRYNLLDLPDKRKFHKKAVPFTGGVVLIISYVLIVFMTDFKHMELNNILTYQLLICMAGFLDDKYKLNPGSKITLQLIPIILIINTGLYLKDIGGYIYLGNLELGSFSVIFTIMCGLLIINAFNYSDGIDSLVATIGVIILISYAIYGKIVNPILSYDYLIVITVPLAIFIFFNFGIIKKYKIFLGDSGSNTIGFLIGFLAIFLYIKLHIHPSLLIWPLAYVIYEFLTVNMIRIFFKKKIFKPGHDHLHYELIKYFKISQLQSLMIISLINIFFSIIGMIFYSLFIYDINLALFPIIFLIYFFLRLNFYNKFRYTK